jgi:hypothetical protein
VRHERRPRGPEARDSGALPGSGLTEVRRAPGAQRLLV